MHNQPLSLYLIEWQRIQKALRSASSTSLFDIVERHCILNEEIFAEIGPEEDKFPGLYADCLQRNCWSPDDDFIYISCLWRSRKKVLQVSALPNGPFYSLPIRESPNTSFYFQGSSNVKCVCKHTGLLFVSLSSPNDTGTLVAFNPKTKVGVEILSLGSPVTRTLILHMIN